MRSVLVLIGSLGAAALASTYAPRAQACGACFSEARSGTVVSGHRMILSISNEKTTLWDQIIYSGNPESFAWVLPVKGLADVGLSSDALFENLEVLTGVTIQSPIVNCGGGSGVGAGTCSSGFASSAAGGGGVGGDVEPVEVVAHAVVGPYEMVQLSTQEPAALQIWLDSHGYAVPVEFAPVIDAYVTEGFDFLALKLVPGQGVDAMRPVRVSVPGASPTLPLRMVAAGTGAITPMTLWIFGEGRYEPANFPWFTIAESDLIWDWNTSSSNYKQLRQQAYEDSLNEAWLVEAAGGVSKGYLESALLTLAATTPVESGYADEDGLGATEACQADLEDLFGTIDESLWVTRIRAELSLAALASDLDLQAASSQQEVPTLLEVYDGNTVGDPCGNPIGDCYSGSGSAGTGTSTGAGPFGGNGGSTAADPDADEGCAIGAGPSPRWGAGVLALLGLAAAWCVRRTRPRPE